MSDETRRILAMVAEGRISAEEGERLLEALGPSRPEPSERPMPKFLKIEARSSGDGKEDALRVRVPLALIRAGLKMRGLVPEAARGRINDRLKEKGIGVDLFAMSEGEIDEVIRMLSEVEIEASDDDDRLSVRLE